MARYHVNPATGNPGICKAKLSCRFGDLATDHFASVEEARSAYEARQNLRLNRRPILLEPLSLPPVDSWDAYGGESLLEAAGGEPVDYYSNDWSFPEEIQVESAVAEIIGVAQNEWPESLRSEVSKNRETWSDLNEWTFEHGYYDGDSAECSPPRAMIEGLKQWYYSHPNATDREGVLEHVREKGYDTSGLTPLEAVKKMLREENGMSLPKVERASSVRAERHYFSGIARADDHMERIEASEPKPASPRSREILGVIRVQGNRSRLMDGHHRLKYAEAQGRQEGEFLVLY